MFDRFRLLGFANSKLQVFSEREDLFPQSYRNVPIFKKLLCNSFAPLCGNDECILPELNLKLQDYASSKIWCISKLHSWDLARAKRTCIRCSSPVLFEIIFELKISSVFGNPVEIFSKCCHFADWMLLCFVEHWRQLEVRHPGLQNQGACSNG